MADYPARQFFGTPQTVYDYTTDIAAGVFAHDPGTVYDNTNDAAIPYAPYAVAMIEAPDWAAAPAAGTMVELWGVLQAVDGTDNDTDPPTVDAAASNGARLMCAWVISAADALQRRTALIDMRGIKKFEPWIKNATGQAMNNDGGTHMVVKITPLSVGITM